MQRFWLVMLAVVIVVTLFAGCGGSSGGSSSTTTPPTVSLSATSSAIVAGQSTTLIWTSTNATSVLTSNFAASQVQGTVSVSPTTTTTYNITVLGSGGQASSAATVVVTPLATTPSAVSVFAPAIYTPGSGVAVTLTITPLATASSYAVQDAPPAGWTVSNISASGTWDAVNNLVKWGPFFDATPRTLQYTVTPPLTASGSQTFSGVASFDGTSIPISGNRTIAE